MLLHGVIHVLIDRQQDLFVAPIKLLLVVSTKGGKNIRFFYLQLLLEKKYDNQVHAISTGKALKTM